MVLNIYLNKFSWRYYCHFICLSFTISLSCLIFKLQAFLLASLKTDKTVAFRWRTTSLSSVIWLIGARRPLWVNDPPSEWRRGQTDNEPLSPPMFTFQDRPLYYVWCALIPISVCTHVFPGTKSTSKGLEMLTACMRHGNSAGEGYWACLCGSEWPFLRYMIKLRRRKVRVIHFENLLFVFIQLDCTCHR